MKEEIEKLERERANQEEIEARAHQRIVAINLRIRQLQTLQKKVDAVLATLKGDEIKVV